MASFNAGEWWMTALGEMLPLHGSVDLRSGQQVPGKGGAADGGT